MDKITKLIAGLSLAFATALILSLLFYVGFLSNINLKLTDSLYGGKNPISNIVIVAIDDKSLQEIGKWPWNREVIASAITKLNQSKTIGIDVGFFEKSDKGNDTLLGNAIKNHGNVIMSTEYTSFENQGSRIIGKNILKPIDELNAGIPAYINVITDKDGITRGVNLDISSEFDSFGVSLYKNFWKKEFQNNEQRFLINFAGKPKSFKYYSISDVINNKYSPEEFKDKLVLIGATSPELHDNYIVPTSKGIAMPGVELHANTVQTLINKDFIKQQSKISTILIIFVTAIITAILISRYNILGASIVAFAIIIIYFFMAIYMFNKGILLNIIYVPLTTFFTYLTTTTSMYIKEKKSKALVVNAFNKYVSPLILNEIIKDPSSLKLGGVRRDITVFFSDIRGFTSISEQISAEQLVHILNEYLTAMTDIVLHHQGVVDKYIGDAIMAFWGAPLDQPNHATLACETSLDMLKELKKLQEKWNKENFPEIKIGIGLNSGEAVIGNMGSYDRFNYTAMGDNINLGSRLESLTKQYGVFCLISESTKIKVSDEFITRELDLVTVKGKKKPIKIYELICRKGELDDKNKKIIEHYEKGFTFYLQRQFNAAIEQFNEVLKLKDDLASKNMIERCNEFKKSPPEKDWIGVYEFHTK